MIYRITDQLFQAGKFTSEEVQSKGIGLIVDMIGSDRAVADVMYLSYPIADDRVSVPDWDRIADIAAFAASRIEAGEKVLSACGVGVNRSALMNAHIIHNLQPELSGEQIINRIKEGRPGSLTGHDAGSPANPIFLERVRGL